MKLQNIIYGHINDGNTGGSFQIADLRLQFADLLTSKHVNFYTFILLTMSKPLLY